MTTDPYLRAVLATLPAYVPGRRPTGENVLALASNESHHAPLPGVMEAALDGLERISRYPDAAAVALRERLAEHIGVTADEIGVGPGSVGVLQQILSATCDEGDEVVFAWRSFEAYPILVALAGATAVPVPLDADDEHDLDAMLAAITRRTKVVLLCSPNNPTGTSIDPEALSAFIHAAPRRVLLVIDEAYVEFASKDTDALPLWREHPNVCLLRTFSKAYGLAGLRVGYAIAHPPLARGLRASALPFGVTTVAQQAAIASLDAHDDMRARAELLISERDHLVRELRARGWRIPSSAGNFVWIRVDEADRLALTSRFDDAGLLVRSYAGDGIRVTVTDRAATNRILAALDSAPQAERE